MLEKCHMVETQEETEDATRVQDPEISIGLLGKCMMLYAPTVVRRRRFHLNQPREDLFTAWNAFQSTERHARYFRFCWACLTSSFFSAKIGRNTRHDNPLRGSNTFKLL